MRFLPQDLRYAARKLAHSPGFSLVAILTLALGIGATAAIFTVVRAVILQPLPYDDPDRVVMVWNQWKDEPKGRLSGPELFDYREAVPSLEKLAVYAIGEMNLTGDGEPERARGAVMTAEMFDVLGVEPVLGRPFGAEEDRPGGEDVILLGHGLWQRRFGGDPAVIGRTIQVNGSPNTVVGVMPEGFRLPLEFEEPAEAQLYMPLALDPADPGNRSSHYMVGVGKLRPGATQAQAERELGAEVRRWKEEGVLEPSKEFAASVVPVGEEVTGDVRPALFVLLAAVGLVLLIACANVANLLLARADTRRREIAVRTAIGAGRARILRQLLTESLLLAVLGGVGGLLLAMLGVEALIALAPAGVPRIDAVRLDATVLGFGVGITLLTGILFGIAPAVSASRASLSGVLRESGRGVSAGRARQRFRRALVVGEIALSVVLVIGAGLLIRTFWELRGIDLGFQTEEIVTARIALPSTSYPDPEDVVSFFSELEERLEAIPGARAAGAARVLPLQGEIGDWGIDIEGMAEPEGNGFSADWQAATPGYMEALGIPLLRGRPIGEQDRADAPPVVVINRTLAERHWPGEDPVGARLRLASADDSRPWLTVVGVVEDVRHNTMTEEPRTELYLPHAQTSVAAGQTRRTMSVVLSATGSTSELLGRLREEVRAMDPNLPVADMLPLAEIVGEAQAQPRFVMLLLLVFAALALTLAAVGVYGMIAYAVTLRTHEFGVRLALGAEPGSIVRLVMRDGLFLVIVGTAVGAAGAVLAAQALRSMVYGVAVLDPATFLAVPLLLAAVALLASAIPARSAATVDPVVALRRD